MSSPKEEIETWVAALEAYDANEFEGALRHFAGIAFTAKIHFNMGIIRATLGEHAQAVVDYQRAVMRDQYLAVAYFQQGVSNFLLGDFEEALANFNDALLYLRGNRYIDYAQLGLKFKLHSCEVLFNRGLCYIYLQQKDAGMQDLSFAAREKSIPDHDVIDEAIREQAEGYTVFSIPVGVVYRPNEAKVKNLKSKHYLSRPRVVHDQLGQQNGEVRRDPDCWSSTEQRRIAALAALANDGRATDDLSYAAVNLVRPNLQSRTRLQSEPPRNRDIFPPTPPPEPDRQDALASRRRTAESERPDSTTTRRHTGETSHSSQQQHQQQQSRQVSRPPPLELGVAAFDQSAQAKPRIGTKRSESERPAMRREASGESSRNADARRFSQRSLRDLQPDATELRNHQQYQQQQQQQQQQPQRSSAHSHHRPRSSVPMPLTISEEDEDDQTAQYHQQHPRDIHALNTDCSYNDDLQLSGSDGDTLSPLAFEIVAPQRTAGSNGTRIRSRGSARRTAPPQLRSVRVKVHAQEVRYVMTTPDVTFDALIAQIGTKLGISGGFKIKIRDDDGDMVTLGDQDDLDLAIAGCAAAAAKEKVDLGKLEVWIQEV